MKAFIFAGNYNIYLRWVKLNKLDTRDYIYISRKEQTLGIGKDIPYILLHDYYKSKAYDECYYRLFNHKKAGNSI